MNRTLSNLVLGTSLGLLSGCDFAAQERVVLLLPGVAEIETAKAAVDLVASVMTNAGFSQTIASAYSDATIVASFKGSGRLVCMVFHRSGRMEIVLDEFGRRACKSSSVNCSLATRLSPFGGRRSDGERSEPNADGPRRGSAARFASLAAGHLGVLLRSTKHSNNNDPHDPPERF